MASFECVALKFTSSREACPATLVSPQKDRLRAHSQRPAFNTEESIGIATGKHE